MNSRVSFRRRPIDIEKSIPIISDEIENEEELPSPPNNDDIKENIEIPIPVITTLNDSDPRQPFHPRRGYIKFQESWFDDDDAIEYDYESEDESFAQDHEIKPTTVEYLIDRFEKLTGFDKELVSFEKVKYLQDSTSLDSKQFKSVYEFWHSKRMSRIFPKQKQFYPCGKPLLPRFEVPPPMSNVDPHLAFRPREKEKTFRKQRRNDHESLMKMKQLRTDFERLRIILELVKKREQIKQEIATVNQKILDYKFNHIDEFVTSKKESKRKSKVSAEETNALLFETTDEETDVLSETDEEFSLDTGEVDDMMATPKPPSQPQTASPIFSKATTVSSLKSEPSETSIAAQRAEIAPTPENPKVSLPDGSIQLSLPFFLKFKRKTPFFPFQLNLQHNPKFSHRIPPGNVRMGRSGVLEIDRRRTFQSCHHVLEEFLSSHQTDEDGEHTAHSDRSEKQENQDVIMHENNDTNWRQNEAPNSSLFGNDTFADPSLFGFETPKSNV
eukprot:gb/GECH01007010.1/.p1 GENE.gb/GECH01007010.1/~~gb/GECH01007010.1/.p1  ORF type:complete len:499 (+),score=154.97 gb/GECH01007010.1/:1-1497(+)